MSSAKKKKIKMLPCHCCHGSGNEMNLVDGARMKALRKAHGFGLRQVARKMGISHSYLHQLEAGNRNWSMDLIADMELAMNL